jgi:SulP family sulfate permease
MKKLNPSWWSLYVPKLITVLQEGYSLKFFQADVLAGLTVAIVAIPLAMALGIASGTTPDKGLITAVIAGFLISALGGSRVQIGGPTGAFVVVVFNVIAAHGYDGLVLATLMAGVMLLVAGFARLGTWIKYIPQPVITGFTAGIAVIIFSSQVRDLFGLQIEKVPGDFIEKWQIFWGARDSYNPSATFLSLGCLILIIGLRKYAPSVPAFLMAVLCGSLVVLGLHLPVATIGSAFGELPHSLPMPHIPEGITLLRMKELLPSAFTIAFLAGIESLLSAVVADGMIDRRHRSNCELVGQGVANMASAFFGGMPATGAIARTVTNIRSGAKSPVAGILHAVFILMAMLFLAPLASYIPLASLAAILVVVAWNMSEQEKIKHLMHAPKAERAVMCLTFFLTVAVDLTVAIEVGVVLSAIIFMHQMSKVVELETHHHYIDEDVVDTREDRVVSSSRQGLPEGVLAYAFRGPLFFGVATQLIDLLEQLNPVPKTIILNMEHVPLIDASGEASLRTFINRCQKKHIFVIFSGLHHTPMKVLKRMGIVDGAGEHYMFTHDFNEALSQLT